MVINLNGFEILIDEQDIDLIKEFSWEIIVKPNTNYVIRKTWIEGKTHIIRLHRVILKVQDRSWKEVQVDHINGNGLDNRRENLRLVTPSQNMFNSKKPKNNTSGFKGVDYSYGKYRARISVNSKRIELGRFSTAEEAARAYDVAAKAYHGEYAVLNFKD